jgi:hypothetical protein
MERPFQGNDWYRDFGQADGCFQAAFHDSNSLVGKLPELSNRLHIPRDRGHDSTLMAGSIPL